MQYKRMPIEIESPEQMGYDKIRYNLSESSYTDVKFNELGDLSRILKELVLCYGSHMGHEGLRELVAQDTPLKSDGILLTMGAAGGLFIIATSLLERGDELVVVRPNYATNLETPRSIGAEVRYVDLRFEEGFALDLLQIERAISDKTKYVSVTYPHNPTGVCLSHAEMQALSAMTKKHGVRLLVDETYRDMVFGQQLPLAATYGDHVISISSLSKTYGLPGLRMGWIICRDQQLMATLLAAKEQIHICGSPLDEEIAFQYMQQRTRHFQRITQDIREKFEIVKTWMEGQDELEWVQPQGGCVCFPRIIKPANVKVDKFYKILLEKRGTYVGPGHWFDMPKHYMRIGFGWPSIDALKEGLKCITESMRAAGK